MNIREPYSSTIFLWNTSSYLISYYFIFNQVCWIDVTHVSPFEFGGILWSQWASIWNNERTGLRFEASTLHTVSWFGGFLVLTWCNISKDLSKSLQSVNIVLKHIPHSVFWLRLANIKNFLIFGKKLYD